MRAYTFGIAEGVFLVWFIFWVIAKILIKYTWIGQPHSFLIKKLFTVQNTNDETPKIINGQVKDAIETRMPIQ